MTHRDKIIQVYTDRCATHKDCGWNAAYYISQKDQDERFRKVLRHIDAGASVLDIGCGQGDILNFIDPEKYLGVDVCQPMLDYARIKFPKAQFLNADIMEMPVGNHYDVAIAVGTFSQMLEDNYTYLVQAIKSMFLHSDRLIFTITSDLFSHPDVFHYNALTIMQMCLFITRRVVVDTMSLPFEIILCLQKDV